MHAGLVRCIITPLTSTMRDPLVPENWVEKEGEYRVLQRDYTATELSVEEGETVTVLLMESDWGWATNESGQSGWVPLGHVVVT